MNTLNELYLQPLFYGFGWYTVFFRCSYPFLSKSVKRTVDTFDYSACLLISIFGTIYLLAWFLPLGVSNYQKNRLNVSHLTGFVCFIQPCIVLFSQILWFKSIRTRKWIRIIIATLLISAFDVQLIIIYLPQLHWDYLPTRWSFSLIHALSRLFLNLSVFGSVSIVFHWILTKKWKRYV